MSRGRQVQHVLCEHTTWDGAAMAKRWNERYAVGTRVLVQSHDPRQGVHDTVTVSEAFIGKDGRAVLLVDGSCYSYPVTQCHPITRNGRKEHHK
jgi:hypothetical protein